MKDLSGYTNCGETGASGFERREFLGNGLTTAGTPVLVKDVANFGEGVSSTVASFKGGRRLFKQRRRRRKRRLKTTVEEVRIAEKTGANDMFVIVSDSVQWRVFSLPGLHSRRNCM